jgi:hypothetical protein
MDRLDYMTLLGIRNPKCNEFVNLINSILIPELQDYKGEAFIESISAGIINRVEKRYRKQLLQIKIDVDKNAYEKYLTNNKPLEDILNDYINDIEVVINSGR